MAKKNQTATVKAALHARHGAEPGRPNGFSRTRKDHKLEQAEDYVELIAALTAERGEARAVDMARRLGVTHGTVTRTLARLQKAGLIKTEPYRAIFLTPGGKSLAAKARSRHKIVEDFLIAAGVCPATAALDAEGIEHHVSPETLEILAGLTAKLRA
ncbi:manganese-binding transcriptional regulator MntR [Candidatus Sumerlaeota bacterium]|nr:manganese-binding transcriptional regulator MntR [Candidatus Sumerlaeota bacterium]